MGTFLPIRIKMSGTRQRKKKVVTAEVQEQRDNRRKERNRAAARKCREKRGNQIRCLEDQKETLMATNQEIKKENDQMMQEINYLKSLQEQQSSLSNTIHTKTGQNDHFFVGNQQSSNNINNNEPELEGFTEILADPEQFLEQSELGPIFAMCE